MLMQKINAYFLEVFYFLFTILRFFNFLYKIRYFGKLIP